MEYILPLPCTYPRYVSLPELIQLMANDEGKFFEK